MVFNTFNSKKKTNQNTHSPKRIAIKKNNRKQHGTVTFQM